MTTEQWVRKLNELSAEIDAWSDALHPSLHGTDPALQAKRDQYRKLAAQQTDD